MMLGTSFNERLHVLQTQPVVKKEFSRMVRSQARLLFPTHYGKVRFTLRLHLQMKRLVDDMFDQIVEGFITSPP